MYNYRRRKKRSLIISKNIKLFFYFVSYFFVVVENINFKFAFLFLFFICVVYKIFKLRISYIKNDKKVEEQKAKEKSVRACFPSFPMFAAL